jgi:periplasmic copper chaperone A
MSLFIRAAIVGATLVASSVTFSVRVSAHDFAIGTLKIGHPWARATPPGAKVAGGYLVIENTGATPDRLIGATVAIAGRVEIHEMAVTDGIMRMRELPQGIEIRPGGKVDMRPGSFHLMWIDLTQALKKGDMVQGTLRFAKAGEVAVVFDVDAVGAPTPGHQGH